MLTIDALACKKKKKSSSRGAPLKSVESQALPSPIPPLIPQNDEGLAWIDRAISKTTVDAEIVLTAKLCRDVLRFSRVDEPQSQKAAGVAWLRRYIPITKNNECNAFVGVPWHITVSARKLCENIKDFFGPSNAPFDTPVLVLHESKLINRIFARPCPTRPRHGFVESRHVPTVLDLYTLAEETIAADPDGEIMIMEQIPDALCSAVWTTGRVTIGPGHAGATSGDACVSIPVGIIEPRIEYKTPIPGVNPETEAAYFEVVVPCATMEAERWANGNLTESHALLVQARSGPPQPNAPDYYGRHTDRFRCTRVVKAEGDLLAWEQQCAQLKGVEGVVVNHVGGSLNSHYGVHCLLNEIPCFTSYEPLEGASLYPHRSTYPDGNLVLTPAFAQGLLRVLTARDGHAMSRAEAARFAIFCAHNGALLQQGNYVNMHLMGQAVAYLWLLTACALGGEMRHTARRNRRRPRAQVQEEFWNDPTLIDTAVLSRWRATFVTRRWRSGYGGPAWADCADSALKLHEDIQNFLAWPSPLRRQAILSTMNVLVHKVHNNGNLFTKFVTSHFIKDIQNGDPVACAVVTQPLWLAGLQAYADQDACGKSQCHVVETSPAVAGWIGKTKGRKAEIVRGSKWALRPALMPQNVRSMVAG